MDKDVVGTNEGDTVPSPGGRANGAVPRSALTTKTERMVNYQSLHGLDVRGVDGQGLFIPALGFVHVAPQLGDLPPHVQHVMGRGEEVGGLLCAGRRLGWLRHGGVHLSCQTNTDSGGGGDKWPTGVSNCGCSKIPFSLSECGSVCGSSF